MPPWSRLFLAIATHDYQIVPDSLALLLLCELVLHCCCCRSCCCCVLLLLRELLLLSARGQ